MVSAVFHSPAQASMDAKSGAKPIGAVPAEPKPLAPVKAAKPAYDWHALDATTCEILIPGGPESPEEPPPPVVTLPVTGRREGQVIAFRPRSGGR